MKVNIQILHTQQLNMIYNEELRDNKYFVSG